MIDQLKDIKPIVDIPDNSLIYLVILTLILLILLGVLIRFAWKILKPSKDYLRKNALNQLQNLNFSNAKTTAYSFNRYGGFLLNDDNQKQFEQIQNALIQYKYKKQVGVLEADLIANIKEFINV